MTKAQATHTTTFVAVIAGIGMFLSTLDSGIINIAVPFFIQIFHATLNTVIWTVTLYALVISASIMIFGKLADRYGRLKIYVMGLTLFAISSLLCGLSPSIKFLITFRVFQGLGAAMMQATAIAVITTKLEKEEMTKAIGLLGMLMGLGPTLGPVLGGFILSTIGWRWIFWLNIPICLYALYGCYRLKGANEILHPQSLNYFNLFLFGISMFLLLLSMNYMKKNITLALFLLGCTLITALLHILIEVNSRRPIINYQLFKNISFTAPMIGVIALGGATAIAFILPPLFFEKLRHFAAWQIGLVSVSASCGIVITSKIFGEFNEVFGKNITMIIGLAIMTISLILLAKINIDWNTSLIFALLFCYGFGVGLFMTSNILHLTAQFSLEKQGFISSLIRMIQNAAVAFGAAGSAMVISTRSTVTPNLLLGIQHAWLLAAALSFLALIALIYMYIKTNGRSTQNHEATS
jgi:EmrB/QacA subfamily drug resistance transporter